MSSQDGHHKLRAIIGMLGSDHDGERANAARLATAELRRLGLTWADLVNRAFGQAPPRPQPAQQQPSYPQAGAGFANAFQWPNWQTAAQPRADAATAQQQAFRDRQRGSWEQPPPRQRTYSASRRTSSRDGYRLWDLVRFASLHGQRLSRWENDLLATFLAYGPNCAASEAQWKHLLLIAEKLNVKASA